MSSWAQVTCSKQGVVSGNDLCFFWLSIYLPLPDNQRSLFPFGTMTSSIQDSPWFVILDRSAIFNVSWYLTCLKFTWKKYLCKIRLINKLKRIKWDILTQCLTHHNHEKIINYWQFLLFACGILFHELAAAKFSSQVN